MQVETLAIAASGDEIRRAAAWLTTTLRQRDVPDPQVECLELALHEVLANVLDHGGSAARAEPIGIPHRPARRTSRQGTRTFYSR